MTDEPEPIARARSDQAFMERIRASIERNRVILDKLAASDHTTGERVRLICWDEHHVQMWTAGALRTIVVAPVCTARVGDGICGSAIWAVEHDGEPRRYVGRPPHANWHRWAERLAT